MVEWKTKVNLNESMLERASGSLDKVLKSKDLGFFRWEEALSDVQNFVKNHKNWYSPKKHLVFVGTGGSSLGIESFYGRFDVSINKEVHFFDNVDPQSFTKKIKKIDLSDALIVIISKSGTTLETLSQASIFADELQKNNLALSESMIIITEDRDSPLNNWAQSKDITILDFPKNVGGRFSCLSVGGLLPCELMYPESAIKLVDGASWAIRQKKMLISIISLILQSFEKREFITYFWVYSDGLRLTGDWIQQLWAESLAKLVDNQNQTADQVSVPIPLKGTQDQHSVLQQIMEGQQKQLVFFLNEEFEENALRLRPDNILGESFNGKTLVEIFNAERAGVQQALDERQISTANIIFKDSSLESQGAIWSLLMLTVASVGVALDINPFDQPGVELGKRRALEKLNVI